MNSWILWRYFFSQKYWLCLDWNIKKTKMRFHKLFDPIVYYDGNADSGLNINTLMHLFCRCICWRDNLVWPHTLLSLILSPHSRSLFSADIDTLVVLFLQNRTTYTTVSILANLLLSMSVLSFHSFCQIQIHRPTTINLYFVHHGCIEIWTWYIENCCTIYNDSSV